jgi:hypothetical protein
MPKFKVIGNTFQIGPGLNMGDFRGPVVASRDAFYLCVLTRPGEHLAGHFGGLVGILLYKGIGALFKRRPHELEFKIETLPPEITDDPEWPVKKHVGTVIVVPREIINRIQYGFWTSYDLVCGKRTYLIGLKFFTRSRVLASLNEMGWDEKLDRSNYRSAIRQLAPFWGLLCGAAFSFGIGLVLGKPPFAGRGAAIEYGAIGAMIGMAIGAAIYYGYPKQRES